MRASERDQIRARGLASQFFDYESAGPVEREIMRECTLSMSGFATPFTDEAQRIWVEASS